MSLLRVSYRFSVRYECDLPSQYQDQTKESKCENVEMGYYVSVDEESKLHIAQIPCKEGYMCNGTGVMIACSRPSEYQDEKKQSICKSVEMNYFKENNKAQESCTRGFMCPGDGGVKVACSAPGEYQDSEGKSGCKSVTLGSYKVSDTSINECPKGFRCNETKLPPVACSATGEYQDKENQSVCKQVEPGFFKKSDTEQELCPVGHECSDGEKHACDDPGQYQNEEGEQLCKNVTAGFYKFANSKQEVCDKGFRCPGFVDPGFVDNRESGKMIPCSGAKEYADVQMSFECKEAGEGYYVLPEGTGVAHTERRKCPIGYKCDGKGAREACDGSTEYQDTEKMGSCNTVKQGHYVSPEEYGSAHTEEIECEEGYRCDGKGLRVACSNKKEYQNSRGKDSCEKVTKGHYVTPDEVNGLHTSQKECEIGFECDGQGYQRPCVDNVTFADETGLAECKTCNVHCPPGMSTYNNCTLDKDLECQDQSNPVVCRLNLRKP